jgi:hypothetical protein
LCPNMTVQAKAQALDMITSFSMSYELLFALWHFALCIDVCHFGSWWGANTGFLPIFFRWTCSSLLFTDLGLLSGCWVLWCKLIRCGLIVKVC